MTKYLCVNITNFTREQIEKEHESQKQFIEIMKNNSELSIEIHHFRGWRQFIKFRNWIIVRLNMISFVAHIVLNHCVYRLLIKWVFSINYIILSKYWILMMTMRKRFMVFQLISSKNWRIFPIIIGEKASTNIPVRKIYGLRNIAKLTRLYEPMYLELDDYSLYSYNNMSFLRHTLTETCDAFMYKFRE